MWPRADQTRLAVFDELRQGVKDMNSYRSNFGELRIGCSEYAAVDRSWP